MMCSMLVLVVMPVVVIRTHGMEDKHHCHHPVAMVMD